MCGIAGLYIKDPNASVIPNQLRIEQFINELLLGIEVRGRDATGIVSAGVGGTEAKLCKGDVPATTFVHWRTSVVPEPRFVLCHTRFSTKGDPSNELNNHPVQYESVFAVHNGHIRNDDELFKKYEDELPRKGQVDSEIISALFHKHGIDKAHLALQELDGTFAVAVADPARNPDTVLLAKGSVSPLVILETPYTVVWSSTKDSITKAWREVFGKDPKGKWFSDLGYGHIRIITPTGVEKLEFKPFTKTYSSSSYSHNRHFDRDNDSDDGWAWGHRRWNAKDDDALEEYNWRSSLRERWNEQCTCGHDQFYHGGPRYEDNCVRADCDCKKFESLAASKKKQELESDYEFIDRERYQRKVTVYTGSSSEPIVKVRCVGCDELCVEDDALTVGGYFFCKSCQGEPDSFEEQERFLEELREEENELVSLLVEEVAREMELAARYIHWLLFEADDDDFNNEPYLVSAYCAAQDLYDEKEKLFKDRLHWDAIETAEGGNGGDTSCGVVAFDDEDCV